MVGTAGENNTNPGMEGTSSGGGSVNRRQAEFHQTFRSISNQEILIESYACALHREILLQGRLYLGEEHLCFYANILGWITSVVIALRDVVSIEKRNTALIFPNAIQVATLHHRYFFASFVYRDDAFTQLQRAWRRALLDKATLTGMAAVTGDDDEVDLFTSDNNKMSTASGPVKKKDQLSEETDFKGVETSWANDLNGCSCDFHYEVQVINSLLLPLPFSTVRSLLFDEHSSFLSDFYRNYAGSSDYQVTAWGVGATGIEQRNISLTVSLPRILAHSDHYVEGEPLSSNHMMAQLKGIERILTFIPTRKHITEAQWTIEGLVGGMARMHTRFCLIGRKGGTGNINTNTSNNGNGNGNNNKASHSKGGRNQKTINTSNGDSSLTISIMIEPPVGSFFKEAMKTVLVTHFAELYKAMGASLILHHKQENLPPAQGEEEMGKLGVRTELNWFGPLGKRLKWLLIIGGIGLVMALIFGIVLLKKGKTIMMTEIERMNKLQSIDNQLKVLLEGL